MNAKIKLLMEDLKDTSLYRKFSISFLFMSLVPIVLIIFIVYVLKIDKLVEGQLPYFRLTILFVVLLSLASFDLIRRSMVSLMGFTNKAREIANGDYDKRVNVETKDEIGRLAGAFNKITEELESKIKEIEASKKLVLSILEKVGTAVTSTKGIENLLELVIQSLTQGIDAKAGAIFTREGDPAVLKLKVSFGLPEGMKGLQVTDTSSLLAHVVEFRKQANISNVSSNAASHFEYKAGLAHFSLIASPMLHKEKALGAVIICDRNHKDSFGSDDMILLANVSSQLAVAIENFELNEDAEKTYLETISALAVAIEAKDPYSMGHLKRVSEYVDKLAKQINISPEMVKALKSGAVLHDIGKIGIRDEVLKKMGPLTENERNEMKEHVIIGVNIIKPIRSMSTLVDLVRHHQEWYDGSGYPDGLKGEQIPLESRILKVCDAYDAMTTDRPYRRALNKEEAKQELIKHSGTEFDPGIVQAFVKII